MNMALGVVATPAAFAVVLISGSLLAGCATLQKPPQITYDAFVPPLPTVPAVATDQKPKPLHVPPSWSPTRGGAAGNTPTARVENANAAARVQPRREGYYNAIQIYPWSEGALYQVYAAPGQITDIALEPGESLTGTGPIAAGDTARWIIGDTESGSGITRRVHVLVKPSRADITTNLVITTDRRSYMIELRADEKPYMPAVAWAYPAQPAGLRQPSPTTPIVPDVTARNYRYRLTGDTPAWRPVAIYDDGRRVYVEFPRGIVQGEMPPIFVIGPDGEPQVVNSRVYHNALIVDRLFAAAELRLGSGKRQQTVRILRSDGAPIRRLPPMPGSGAAPKDTNVPGQRGGQGS
ncbi:P-type conjugative transfer protein TrbG [Mesorhizobium sp. M1C.F.Ca.ET.193.01.1.1]|uniref:P-type conjugative transfer protein TrbG n=1 Tax=unclassified Mesorhizobium TaxID=325217 RepID=UPI000FD21D00|nr:MULTISPECIES: P-type conjugative transfer protein TrbG [unclassified Mesorhizobium]TGS92289.1 P-type conjugative transfer protein TrbG [bacterium M00.F.Ca.ET.177.01.1.1]TGQ50183.1 P-type conjugative transfer protein TrbG [Mesorhizobium sp. M1C.F.Ca.ET.210.01.1.1]TGQ64872.1 P-type conjugative transfer protein TrbG [Mesorhizobium sp. M1C.F.Ca.ET.212.01.1.1]TGQ98653.1 P-type conjugative transfer protein TrbG [Mesorhizobium sp. M1C.F.Ca.ET.204.01.1.1]TGR18890.1 P-type conjugative transfer prote